MGVRAVITDKILQALQAGLPPWRKGWTASGLHLNASSQKPYRGINQVILCMNGGGFADPRWLTYRQAHEAGYQVRQGEHSTKIVRVVEIEKSRDGAKAENDSIAEEGSRRIMRFYDVFNAEQIEGMPAIPPRTHAILPVEAADAIVEGMKLTGLKVFHGAPTASYSPHVDTIRLPAMADFHSTEDYYGTLLHESAHATGAPHRLNRDMTGRFGSVAYAKEELRAEIASAMVSAEAGIALGQHHIDSHASYLASWITVLKCDPNEIFRATGEAQAICDYLQAQALKIEPPAARDLNYTDHVAPSPAKSRLRM